MLSDYLNIVITVLGSVGALGFYSKIREERRQSQSENFHKYSKQYQELMAKIISIGSLDRPFSSKDAEDRSAALTLFMLFSEEFYLGEERKLIDSEIWSIWKDGIRSSMQKEYFCQAWDFCRSQMDLEGNFGNYLESIRGHRAQPKIEKRAA